MIEIVAALGAVVSLITLILVVMVLVRLRTNSASADIQAKLDTMIAGGDRAERAVREEAGRGRDEARAASKELREELGGHLRGIQTTMVSTMTEMQKLEKAQLELFAKQLGDGAVKIEARVNEMAKATDESMAQMRQAAQAGQERLHELLDGKLGELMKGTAESDRALREEVQLNLRRLGDGIAETMTRLGDTQKERLEAVTKEIGDLSAKHQQDQMELRETVALKMGEIRTDSAASAKGLREEVTNTLKQLGEALTTNIGASSQAQNERLTAVAKEIETLASKQQQDQVELRKTVETKLGEIRTDAATSAKGLREEVTNTFKQLGETLTSSITTSSQAQKERLEQVAKEIAGLTQKQEQAQEGLRKTVEQRLDTLRTESTEKLETIRKTVDEQLQGTLEKRLGESFKLVSDRLEQVHKGLGEMQSLANGVGDLKRVLTNVKARGTWGEVQLGNLLEQMLTPDQFLRDAQTKVGSQERVEFAIRLPGRGEGDAEVLLPIDAKFPHEDYDRLLAAADKADSEGVEAAAKQLEARIRGCAKDIRDKYINPPATTDFAFLFLPTEGLYAEVLRRPGLVEQIQRESRVTITGPTTLAATLNALQMGFRTLAIQKRSSEVWQVLEAVKTEFGKYGDVLEKVHKKLQEASKTIDDVSVRRRAIDRKLRAVGTMPDEQAASLLEIGQGGLDEIAEDGIAASLTI